MKRARMEFQVMSQKNLEQNEVLVKEEPTMNHPADEPAFVRIDVDKNWNSQVLHQNTLHQNDSIRTLLEIMQRMDRKIENQEVAHKKEMSEMKETLERSTEKNLLKMAQVIDNQEASFKQEMSEMKELLEASFNKKFLEMKKDCCSHNLSIPCSTTSVTTSLVTIGFAATPDSNQVASTRPTVIQYHPTQPDANESTANHINRQN